MNAQGTQSEDDEKTITPTPPYKIILLGNKSVGKSSFRPSLLTYEPAIDSPGVIDSTVGEFKQADHQPHSKKVIFYEVSANPIFKCYTESMLSKLADVIMVFLDITQPDIFNTIRRWHEMLNLQHPDCYMMVIFNKHDLDNTLSTIQRDDVMTAQNYCSDNSLDYYPLDRGQHSYSDSVNNLLHETMEVIDARRTYPQRLQAAKQLTAKPFDIETSARNPTQKEGKISSKFTFSFLNTFRKKKTPKVAQEAKPAPQKTAEQLYKLYTAWYKSRLFGTHHLERARFVYDGLHQIATTANTPRAALTEQIRLIQNQLDIMRSATTKPSEAYKQSEHNTEIQEDKQPNTVFNLGKDPKETIRYTTKNQLKNKANSEEKLKRSGYMRWLETQLVELQIQLDKEHITLAEQNPPRIAATTMISNRQI